MYFLSKYVELNSEKLRVEEYDFLLFEARLFLEDPEKYRVDNGTEQTIIIQNHLQNGWVKQQLGLI